MLALDNEFTVDEVIDDLWSDWPWFDEETTRYQLNWILKNDKRGEEWKPVGCHNESERWLEFCIGYDDCPYDIYSSLPFRDEVYDFGD